MGTEHRKHYETLNASMGVKTYDGNGGETAGSRLGSAMHQSRGGAVRPDDWVGGLSILVLAALGVLFWLGLNWLEGFREGMRIEATRREWFPLGQGAVVFFCIAWPALTGVMLALSLGLVTRSTFAISTWLRVLSAVVVIIATYVVVSLFLIAYAPLRASAAPNWSSLIGVAVAPVVGLVLVLLLRRMAAASWQESGRLSFGRWRAVALWVLAVGVFAVSLLLGYAAWVNMSGSLASLERFGREALRPDETYAWIFLGGLPTFAAAFVSAIIFMARRKD